ncbi:adenosylhomocysteinase [Candidatus Peregrinibacteria bacterium]|nr:adenosylhomocysteinase [Candidatus Peregrinibacteria bacterium]
MPKYQVKDIKLAAQGDHQLDWARTHMPALQIVKERFSKTKPFKNLRIGMALHVTKETGILVETLMAGGAQVSIASCNPLSTQDDVAASLAKKGISVFAYKGETKSDYYKFIKAVIAEKPHITIDDGCDLVSEIHLKHTSLIPKIIGGCEETTTGINRLKAMAADNALKYPMVAVNDNKTKHLFDNYYGTGQSTWDGILRATNILVAGKTVVIAGYGDCGRGITTRAKGLGAHVIITEIDPLRALQATMDGYQVMPMENALKIGDVFITATGGKHIINTSHIKKMKSGAILANSGHFNVEIDVEGLEKLASKKTQIRPFATKYILPNNNSIYLLGEGRLINLAAAEGHPSEVMDMSFCGQSLACEWLVKRSRMSGVGGRGLKPAVYTLPNEVDEQIAHLKLQSLGIKIDAPTKDQQKYAQSWQEGT